jgi:acetoacetyl-CoA synthetase
MNESMIWQPSSDPKPGWMRLFWQFCRENGQAIPREYQAQHHWSVSDPGMFWTLFLSFCRHQGWFQGEGSAHPALMPSKEAWWQTRWFPKVRFNVAESILGQGEGLALNVRTEEGLVRQLTYDQLRSQVIGLACALKSFGVAPGDRVAAMITNGSEAIVGMLATAAIGAIWSSCSPDFGIKGIVDRFGQIEPKVMLVCGAYRYKGKVMDMTEKLVQLRKHLPSVDAWVLVDEPDRPVMPGMHEFSSLIETTTSSFDFQKFPFQHPWVIVFSSGTTGLPKCMVHSTGGAFLQHLKELALHTDLGPKDPFFYFTTCGWMMWNWMTSSLALGVTLTLFDGNPFFPKPDSLIEAVRQDRIAVFGTSAKYLDTLEKTASGSLIPLADVRCLLSTGSPLAPERFDFVREQLAPKARISSISGGTDLLGCFVLGHPEYPVWRGEIQCAGLGMDVAVVNPQGHAVENEQGELVCRQPFPSMPLHFWNDPEDRRYRSAYFEKIPGVWYHGDFIKKTPRGGFIIYGRSDAVLNPGGVRIGTAELTNVVDAEPDILESCCVGQSWEEDVRILLFVVMRQGEVLDALRVEGLKTTIRQQLTPRHVPAKIFAVEALPRTRSGKIVELAIKSVLEGKAIEHREALANPEALDALQDLKGVHDP